MIRFVTPPTSEWLSMHDNLDSISSFPIPQHKNITRAYFSSLLVFVLPAFFLFCGNWVNLEQDSFTGGFHIFYVHFKLFCFCYICFSIFTFSTSSWLSPTPFVNKLTSECEQQHLNKDLKQALSSRFRKFQF